MIRTLVLLLSVIVVCVVATPAGSPAELSSRRKSEEFVAIDSGDPNEYCMILPREISQSPSGVPVVKGNKTYCTPSFETDKEHGRAPKDLWNFKVFKKGKSPQGYRFAQFTGCLNAGLPPPFDDLNVLLPTVAPNVRFDSDHGGHPRRSKCIGYKHYVEILNPNNNGQACLKCCDDPNGCSATTDPSAQDDCTSVVPGDYCS